MSGGRSLCVDDTRDDTEAVVTCRELGYVSGRKLFLTLYYTYAYCKAKFFLSFRGFVTNFGSVPAHMLRTECSGNETSFLDCMDLPDYDYGY